MTKNSPTKAPAKQSDWIEVTLKISMGSIVVTSILYLAVFRYGLSSDSNDWGAFGSYFGGIVGSMVAFSALIALMKGITLQQSEFKYLREAQAEQRFNDGAAIVFRDALEKIESLSRNTLLEAAKVSDPNNDRFKDTNTSWDDKRTAYNLLRVSFTDDFSTLTNKNESLIRKAGFQISYTYLSLNYPDFVQSANNILSPVSQLFARFDMDDKWKLNPINLYYSQQFEIYFNWYGMAGFSCCYSRMTAQRINRPD